LVADCFAVLNRFKLSKQPGTRSTGNRNTEFARAPAQYSDQVVDRLPRQIARQVAA
jgi:hypothetical protein